LNDLSFAILDHERPEPQGIGLLSTCWLQDQSIAFAATLLGEVDALFEDRPFACASYIVNCIDVIRSGLVSDSTLALITSIDPDYKNADRLGELGLERIAGVADALATTVAVAKRDGLIANGLNRMLISHAVYLLKRPHMTAVNFFKWLRRAAPTAVPGIKRIITELQNPDSPTRGQIDAELAQSRNTTLQARDRLDHLDRFHELVLVSSAKQRSAVEIWWTRICMAYRSSFFCWPLLTERVDGGLQGEGQSVRRPVRGLSLPVSLFIVDDGKSTWRTAPNARGQKVWFKYKLSRADEKVRDEPRFQIAENDMPAHIEGFRFGFTPDWWHAFRVGLDVAKKLWATQNGRLRFADPAQAQKKLQSDLNVDLRAACDIVAEVFKLVDADSWQGLERRDEFFTVADRSAEAYWVQCILSLLLPSGDLPMGVCTGTIDYKDGEFEIGLVEGVDAKLEYANRAGFPRAIVPGDSRGYSGGDIFGDDHMLDNGVARSDAEAVEIPEEGPEDPDPVGNELKSFLDRLSGDRSRKTLEVNFARTARAAADAMQPSGWRRTDFLRTPEFQRAFIRTQRRLFMRDAMRDDQLRRRLKRSDVAKYENRPWLEEEERRLTRLDRLLQSRTGRSVIHVTRSEVRRIAPGMSVEEALAGWVAWKDNQVRRGDIGYRGPGLGVVTLRTAHGDTETRLWAALAEMLDADDGWWAKFQWADLPQAASLLAQLLCNQHADPEISRGSAPDLLLVFDDVGFATERTNPIFPAEFHHQFIDLLNPRHPSNNKRDYLDAALKQLDNGGQSLPTRIVVVLKDGEPSDAPVVSDTGDVTQVERALLNRLGLFRFGCSRHAGFAMVNFDAKPEEQMEWPAYENALRRLFDSHLLSASRDVVYLTDAGRRCIDTSSYFGSAWRLARAHRHAALALCPILSPSGARISTNRDRQLEPENVLEATWHLKESFGLVPWRFQAWWRTNDGLPSVAASLALLTFLRTSPDWDTVLRLRVNSVTRQDSVELSHELLKSEEDIAKRRPSSLAVGQTVETMGRVFKNEKQAQVDIESKAAQVVEMVNLAVEDLKKENLGSTEWKRRLRHLLSRQVFALRMLGLPLTDLRFSGARSYIDNAVGDVLKPEFLTKLGVEREGLDDFPISPDCWRALWSDGNRDSTGNKTLTLTERSRYAYAAARATLGRTGPGGRQTNPWDEPWVAYFVLTRPEDIQPKQIAAPLNTWWSVYGKSAEDSRAFGKRVLNMQPHAQRTKSGRWEERWLSDLRTACGNLWRYVAHSEPSTRLVGPPVAAALRLINVIALQETLPAWRFMQDSGQVWLPIWPLLAGSARNAAWPEPARKSFGFVAEEWAVIGKAVVAHEAGWIAMLSDLKALPDDNARVVRVESWLRACVVAGIARLQRDDPEDLSFRAAELPVVVDLSRARWFACKNAKHVLGLTTKGVPKLQNQQLRDLLEEFASALAR
jgi:hypothetical protein